MIDFTPGGRPGAVPVRGTGKLSPGQLTPAPERREGFTGERRGSHGSAPGGAHGSAPEAGVTEGAQEVTEGGR
jgi:hypothetical protein